MPRVAATATAHTAATIVQMRARGDTEQVATLWKAMATSSETPTVSLREAAELLAGDALFLDVREQGEWDLGHVPEALHIPLGVLEDRVTDELPDREREVVVYCAHGRRSLAALATLRDARVRALSPPLRRVRGVGEERLPRRRPVDPGARPAAPLQPAPADPRDRRGRPAAAARVERAPDRRRRARLARLALPRRRRSRHARDRRRRRRGRVEPPAPDRALDAAARRPEGRVGARHADRAQPGRAR